MVAQRLAVKNLHAWYGGGHALQGVSLGLRSGTTVAVIGTVPGDDDLLGYLDNGEIPIFPKRMDFQSNILKQR